MKKILISIMAIASFNCFSESSESGTYFSDNNTFDSKQDNSPTLTSSPS